MLLPNFISRGNFDTLNRGTIIKLVKEIREIAYNNSSNLLSIKFRPHPFMIKRDATVTTWSSPEIVEDILSHQ